MFSAVPWLLPTLCIALPVLFHFGLFFQPIRAEQYQDQYFMMLVLVGFLAISYMRDTGDIPIYTCATTLGTTAGLYFLIGEPACFRTHRKQILNGAGLLAVVAWWLNSLTAVLCVFAFSSFLAHSVLMHSGGRSLPVHDWIASSVPLFGLSLYMFSIGPAWVGIMFMTAAVTMGVVPRAFNG